MDLLTRIADLERRISLIESTGSVKPDKIYTISDVCGILACGKSNVYDLISSGMLARIDVGSGKGGVRVLGSDIEAFIRSRRSGGPAPAIILKHFRG